MEDNVLEAKTSVLTKKPIIKSDDDLRRALVDLKKSGKDLIGSGLEQYTGKSPNVDVALNGLREKQYNEKTQKVDEKLASKSAGLGIDKQDQDRIKKELESIVKQDKFRSSDEEVNDLARAIAGDREITPEIQRQAKEAKLELDRWQEQNPQEARGYREEKFKSEFVEKTKEKNPEISEEKLELVKEKAELISEVYFSDGGIENQKDLALESNKEESLGKLQNSWSDLEGVAGFLRMTPEETDNLISRYSEIETGLEGVNQPYENFSNARSFDGIIASFGGGGGMLAMFKSAQNGVGFLKGISRFTGGWWDKGITKITNHFASKIGNQAISGFVKNSMGALLQNGLKGGIGAILKGLAGTGAKAALGALGTTVGAATGPIGWAVMAAGFLKKIFGGFLEKMGLGTKKFFEENFGKIGGGLVKGLAFLVAIPTILIGSMGIALATPVIIGSAIGLFGFQMIQTNSLVSSLVPEMEVDTEEVNPSGYPGPMVPSSDGLVINEPVVCSVANKTVADWQCSSENASTYINERSCPVTSVTGRKRTICTSGCGLVSTSIILQAHDPKITAKCLVTPGMGCQSDFFTGGRACPIGWTGIRNTITMNLGEGAIDYDLDTDGDRDGVFQGCDESWVKSAICKGDVVMILLKYIPSGGHWVTAVATLQNGDIVLKDPGYGRTTRQFNYLSNYLKNGRAEIRNCMAVKGSYINSLDPNLNTGSPDTNNDPGDNQNTNPINRIDMNPVPIPTNIIPCNGNTTQYQGILMSKVNRAGYRTREGVVAAAYYLAAEFPYKVPYFWSGGHSWRPDFDTDGGLIGKNLSSTVGWGCIKQQPSGKPKAPFGLDCSGFVDWAYLTAGFRNIDGTGGLPNDPEYRYAGGNIERRYFQPNNCDYIRANIKPGDVLKRFDSVHTGIIVQISGNKIKYAQSSPRGVNIEFVDICTGQRIDGSKNSFEAVDLMDKYFNKFSSK